MPETVSDTPPPAGPSGAGWEDALFVLEEVGYAVAGHDLVNFPSLALSARRVTAVIGHNGSGKSTLIRLLARQLQPSDGSIRFEGRPLRDWGHRAFARKVAYLQQQAPPATGMTVRELVALGRYPWHGALGRYGAADRLKVAEAMVVTGIDALAERLVDTLSGGERQRAWLAMLVAQDAQCLLLDEPISALDIYHQVEVLSLVRQLSRAKGLSVVLVLHDINMAACFCDEIVALHSGRVIARGTPDEIMTPETLKTIYGLDMAVIPRPISGAPVAIAQFTPDRFGDDRHGLAAPYADNISSRI